MENGPCLDDKHGDLAIKHDDLPIKYDYSWVVVI